MAELKIIGRRSVLEAIEAGIEIKRLYHTPGSHGKSMQAILDFARQQRVAITVLSKPDMERMARGQNHQGVIALIVKPPLVSLEALITDLAQKNQPAVALLDGIEDPHNLGAILRVADAAGVGGVIIPKRRSAGLTPGSIKASAGAAYHVPVAEVPNLSRAIEKLQAQGYWIVGADMAGDRYVWEMDFDQPVGFVLGREGEGLHRTVKEKCDFLVRLPMLGKMASLNVSTAAAMLFYERVRQRLCEK